MRNPRVTLNLADGSRRPLEGDTGEDLIRAICGGEFSAPPTTLLILAETDERKTVSIRMPYDKRTEAHISVDLRD